MEVRWVEDPVFGNWVHFSTPCSTSCDPPFSLSSRTALARAFFIGPSSDPLKSYQSLLLPISVPYGDWFRFPWGLATTTTTGQPLIGGWRRLCLVSQPPLLHAPLHPPVSCCRLVNSSFLSQAGEFASIPLLHTTATPSDL